VLKAAKGYRGGRHRLYRTAVETGMRAMRFAYRDRRRRKRDFRRLWITRISAAARMHGLSYSQFMHGLKEAEVDLDRKALAELAFADPPAFETLATRVRQTLGV
jgi:large subunit ribosomal protein L20